MRNYTLHVAHDTHRGTQAEINYRNTGARRAEGAGTERSQPNLPGLESRLKFIEGSPKPGTAQNVSEYL
jgi:hypothetical protein